MNLFLDEEIFNFDQDLVNAWDETKRTCSEINSEKTNNTIYLINVIENYCNVYQIAKMRGYHLALLCDKHKIYLNDKEVKEQGESDFEENLYNAVKEINDEEFTFSKDFHQIHKQAWLDGYFTGFVTSEEGKKCKDCLLIRKACKPNSQNELTGRQKLLKVLEDLSKQHKQKSVEIECDSSDYE